MTDSGSHIKSLVDQELSRIGDPTRRETLQSLLVQPARLSLAWDYGHPGERFDCWLVGRGRDGPVLLVHCERGFGPANPWGLVYAEEGSMGMDSQWHSGLEDAAIAGGMLAAPAGYEVPGPRATDDVG